MDKLLLLLLLICSGSQSMQRAPMQAPNHEIKYTPAYYHQNRNVLIIQANKDKSPVGEITFDISKSEKNNGYIYSIDVDDECRNQGIGYKLFKQAILELKNAGCTKIAWTALGLFDVTTHDLEKIYTRMVDKLKEEKILHLDFCMFPREKASANNVKTRMELTLKEYQKYNKTELV